jgi:hypothetical protein
MKNIAPLIFLVFSFLVLSNIAAQQAADSKEFAIVERASIHSAPLTPNNDDKITPNLLEEEHSISSKTMADTTPPVFENSTPSAENIVRTSFTLKTDIDEAGTIYYVILADGSAAPTASEVKAGTGSGGAGVIDSGS